MTDAERRHGVQENITHHPGERQDPRLSMFTVTDGRGIGAVCRHYQPLLPPSCLRLRPYRSPGRRLVLQPKLFGEICAVVPVRLGLGEPEDAVGAFSLGGLGETDDQDRDLRAHSGEMYGHSGVAPDMLRPGNQHCAVLIPGMPDRIGDRGDQCQVAGDLHRDYRPQMRPGQVTAMVLEVGILDHFFLALRQHRTGRRPVETRPARTCRPEVGGDPHCHVSRQAGSPLR